MQYSKQGDTADLALYIYDAYFHRLIEKSITNKMKELISPICLSYLPIPVAARCKVWVFGRSIAGIADSNPTGGMDVCLL
jgi:hypothetical protein